MRLTNVRVPASLSALARKRRLYALDTYFREAWAELCNDPDLVLATGLVVFKPDALAGRRIRPALEFLGRAGFQPVTFTLFTYDRLLIRETWRYQLNIATDDRIAVVDLLLASAPSLLVLVRDLRWRHGAIPASIRIGALKGPSRPQDRHPGHLRYHLGVINTLFNFIHTADEPIDVVRELGLVCPSSERRRLTASARSGAGVRAELDRQLDQLESLVPVRDLDFKSALGRLRLASGGHLRPVVDAVAAGRSDDWRTLWHHGARLDPPVDPWDVLTVAATVIECNEPGLQPIVPTLGQAAWSDRVGVELARHD